MGFNRLGGVTLCLVFQWRYIYCMCAINVYISSWTATHGIPDCIEHSPPQSKRKVKKKLSSGQFFNFFIYPEDTVPITEYGSHYPLPISHYPLPNIANRNWIRNWGFIKNCIKYLDRERRGSHDRKSVLDFRLDRLPSWASDLKISTSRKLGMNNSIWGTI